ncbi:uncharacterized protein LOC143030636 [Oratosquilla oratoria]|uniref:uncharacterized protein LOC143030636 n=1 Tax=Oratosquilla oratoria TaxID=337810 RepID=UPI003F76BB14
MAPARVLQLHVLLHLLLLLLPPTAGVIETSDRRPRSLLDGVRHRSKNNGPVIPGPLGRQPIPPSPPADALSIAVPSSGDGVLNPWLYKFPPWHVPLNPAPNHFKPMISSSSGKDLHSGNPNTFSDLMDGDVIIDLSPFVEGGIRGIDVQNVKIPASSPYRDEVIQTILEKNGARYQKTKTSDPGQVKSLTNKGLTDIVGEGGSLKAGEPVISFVINEFHGDGKPNTNPPHAQGGSLSSHSGGMHIKVHSSGHLRGRKINSGTIGGRVTHSGTTVGPKIHSVTVSGHVIETGTTSRFTTGGRSVTATIAPPHTTTNKLDSPPFFTPPPSKLHVLPPPTSPITPTLAFDDAALRPTVGNSHRNEGSFFTTLSSLSSDDHLQNDIGDLASSISLKDPSQFSSGHKKLIRGKDGSVFIISDQKPNMKKEDIVSFLNNQPFQKGTFKPSPVDHYFTRAYGGDNSGNSYSPRGRQISQDGFSFKSPSISDSKNGGSPHKETPSQVLRVPQQLSPTRGSSQGHVFRQDFQNLVRANPEISGIPVYWVPFVPGVSLPVLMKNKIELDFPSKSDRFRPRTQNKVFPKGYLQFLKSSTSAGSSSERPAVTSHGQIHHFNSWTSSTSPPLSPKSLQSQKPPLYRRREPSERGKIHFIDNPFRRSDDSSAWRKPSASVVRPSILAPPSNSNRSPRGHQNTGRPNNIQDIIDGSYDTSELLYSRQEQGHGARRETGTSPGQLGLSPAAHRFGQQREVHIGNHSRWVWPDKR